MSDAGDAFEDLGDLGGDPTTPVEQEEAGNDGASPPETTDAPQSKPSDASDVPPAKALFGMWGEKTKGASPLAPGVRSGSPSERPAYTGKRWTPPAKTQSESSLGPAKPYSGKKWTPPVKKDSAPTGQRSELRGSINMSDLGIQPGTPPLPPTVKRTSSPVSKAPPSRTTPPTSRSQSPMVGSNASTPSRPGGPHKIDDLEGELDELRELKRQLQLSQMAASKDNPDIKVKGKDVQRSYDPSMVNVNTKALKDDIASDFRSESLDDSPDKWGDRAKPKPGKLSMGAFWQAKSAGKEAPRGLGGSGYSGKPRSGSHDSPGSGSAAAAAGAAVGVGSATTPQDISERTPVEDDVAELGDLTTPLPSAAAGGGMGTGDVNLDEVQVPTPPMGGPPRGVASYNEATGGVSVISAAPSDVSGGGLTTEFRALVEKLVRQVMPTEIDHIDELIEEYVGRETELLDTLTAMEEELINDGGGGGAAATELSVLSDPDGVYEDDDESYEKEVRLGGKATVAAVTVGAAAVGGAAVVASNDAKGASASVPQHFKDLAAEDARSNATSSATELTSNVKRVGQGERVERKGVDEEGGMPTAVGVPTEVMATPRRSSRPTGDEEEEDKRPDRKKMYIMIGVIAVLLLAGLGAALGVVFGGKSDDGSPDESNKEDYENVPTDPPPIVGPVPTLTFAPTPAPITAGGAGDFFDPNAPPSVCNTPAGEPQELGVRSLDGTYPRVAVDGDYAVVASGAGYVAFFERNPFTNEWRRTEVFGTMTNVGEISSVSISGNAAVVGAPIATTDLSTARQQPLETGAIFIYERPAGGKWKQLKGAYTPDEYKTNDKDDYQKARFGMSVGIDGDLIVAGAPEELGSQGSFTVFHRDGDEDWVQVERIVPSPNLCDDPFMGYSVDVYKGMIASSVDCDINILLYEYETAEAGASKGALKKDQQLQYISPSWGPVSSISMSWDHLVYSTAYGGLFVFRKQNAVAIEGTKFFLSQEMSFEEYANLFEYPLEIDANMMTLAVRNQVFMYTMQPNQKWQRESVVLESKGDFAGYTSPSVSLSDGHLLVGDKVEVNAYDFSSCSTESTPPSPIPTFSPTISPTVPSASPTCIDINLVFDNYPQDTSWKIEADDGFVVAQSPAYDASLSDTTQEVCLPGGNYAFTIMDVYGDGMCCDWGNGSYKLTSAQNFVIAEGGAYGLEETTQFAMPFDPNNPFVETPSTPQTSPTPPQPTPPTPATPPPTPKPTPNPVAPATPPPTPNPTPNPTMPPSPPPTAPPAPSSHQLDVTVVLDQYPVDTTWEIVPEGQTEPLYESIPYVASQAGTPDTQSVDLPAGTYDFIIYDVYGDGICCNWGEGSYQLAFGDDVVASGGSFGLSETKRFSTPDVASSGGTPDDGACYDVSVELKFDSYPQDTSWDITLGGVEFSKSPAFAPGTTEDKQELCLPAGDYVFTMYDVYQDGMCCKWGEGSYVVTTNGQNVIKQGGEFGASESTDFTLP